ncbi:MAG: sensor histidine kinase [Acidimicrobiales bacterium]
MTAWRLGPLGFRLAAALLCMALAAIAVLASVTLIIQRNDVNRLAAAQHTHTAAAVTSALDNAYRATGAWTGADLSAAVVLADTAGAALVVQAPDGTVVLRSGPQALLGAHAAAQVRRPLFILGRQVGVLHLAFPAGGLSPADQRLRTELAQALGVSAAVAVLGALVVARVGTAVLVRPMSRLTAAVRALEAGYSPRPLGERAGPGELGELGSAFDSMAAALEHNEQLRRTLVTDVAHELRTPLAILQAETEALVDGVSDPTPEALASLHDESLRLGRMITDLQTLASAQAAALSLKRHPIDLAGIAASSADALEAGFRTIGVELKREITPAPVCADPDRMRQVVDNLLSNAVKFTPAGGSVLLVVRADERNAFLEVADTGPGVAPAEQAQIFERFFRGGAGRDVAGTGIGLAVVKELVEAHDGEIRLESPPGGGARFVVRLSLLTDVEIG